MTEGFFHVGGSSDALPLLERAVGIKRSRVPGWGRYIRIPHNPESSCEHSWCSKTGSTRPKNSYVKR